MYVCIILHEYWHGCIHVLCYSIHAHIYIYTRTLLVTMQVCVHGITILTQFYTKETSVCDSLLCLGGAWLPRQPGPSHCWCPCVRKILRHWSNEMELAQEASTMEKERTHTLPSHPFTLLITHTTAARLLATVKNAASAWWNVTTSLGAGGGGAPRLSD